MISSFLLTWSARHVCQQLLSLGLKMDDMDEGYSIQMHVNNDWISSRWQPRWGASQDLKPNPKRKISPAHLTVAMRMSCRSTSSGRSALRSIAQRFDNSGKATLALAATRKLRIANMSLRYRNRI